MAVAVSTLEALCAEMDRRYGEVRRLGLRKVTPDVAALHVVVIDELAFYLRAGSKAERNAFHNALHNLVSRGRAAGMVVAAATQKPGSDIVPTWIRDLFSFRLAFRCTTPEASDTVLGQGWASRGYSAATITGATRGVGFLLAEGALPVKLRCFYLTDAEVRAICAGAAMRRSRP
jgi:S-DNA-T family DNA segregation ATPase FtsK/SpoIIIE